MPLFTSPPAPLILNTPGVENAVVTNAVTSGAAYFCPVTVLATVTVVNMRCYFSGSPTGNMDMGIYDSKGANGAPNGLLGNTGAQAVATGVFTKALSANLLLSPGIYWLAFVTTAANSMASRTLSAAGLGALYQTTATNLTTLPATAGTLQDQNFLPSLHALTLGGYS